MTMMSEAEANYFGGIVREMIQVQQAKTALHAPQGGFNLPTLDETHCLPFFARRRYKKDLITRYLLFLKQEQELEAARQDVADLNHEPFVDMEDFH